MNVKMLHDVVIPLLLMDKTATICITTLSTKPGNHANHIVENNLMEVVDISLVCPDCRCAGKSEECRHMEWLRPWWQKTSRFDLVQKLLPPAVFAVEAQGIFKEQDNSCFKADHIRNLFVNQRFDFQPGEVAKYLFISIDPCSGSVKTAKKISEFAWMSACEPGRFIGADSIPTTNVESWKTKLIEHIRMCYRIPALRDAKLIVFIEGNMRTEAYTAKEEILRHFRDASFPGSHDEDTVGVLTLPSSKHAMQLAFQSGLSQRAISLYTHFVTQDPDPIGIVNKLREQLERFSYYTTQPKHPLEAPRYTFSGKGTSADQLDDLAMTALIMYYYMVQFFSPRTKWLHMHRPLFPT